jgi:hypothetical protein
MSADQNIEAIDHRLIVVEQTLPAFDNRLKLLEQEHAQLRSDSAEGWRIVLELRTDMQSQFAAARSDMESRFAAARSETKAQFAEARLETQTQFSEARSETQTQFAAVRSEMQVRFTALEKDVEWMRSNFVTRDELERAINKLTWKMYGFGTALVAAVYFIARNVH